MNLTKPPKRADAHFNGIFYGVTGVGKTTLLGSAQKCKATSPMLFIDHDSGLLSLADTDIDVVRPMNFPELQEVYDFLRHDNTKYRSVGIDTLTEEQRGISMNTILDEVDETAAYKDLARSTPPTRQDWLKSQIHMRKFIRAFRDLSYLPDRTRRLHVFMTAGEKVDETSAMGCPALPGVLGLEAGGYVDVLGRIVIRKRVVDEKTVESRFLYTKEVTTEEGVKFLAKNRLGRFGRGVWDPTIKTLIDKWTGE